MSLHEWLARSAGLHPRVVGRTVSKLEAAEVFTLSDLRVMHSLPVFNTTLTVVTAAKIARALEGVSSSPSPSVVPSRSSPSVVPSGSSPSARAGGIQPLFPDGAVHAQVEGSGWRVWRPSDPPIPQEHPTGERCATDADWAGEVAAVRHGRNMLRWPWRRDAFGQALGEHPMCLARGDLISKRIRASGWWFECKSFVRLWQTLDGRAFRNEHTLPSASAPSGVLLEIGANIGACTAELLVRTSARVIALEPSPRNLYFLTRTLRKLAEVDPTIAQRVVVFPIGAAEKVRPRPRGGNGCPRLASSGRRATDARPTRARPTRDLHMAAARPPRDRRATAVRGRLLVVTPSPSVATRGTLSSARRSPTHASCAAALACSRR